MTTSPLRACATCLAAAWASVLERPTTKVSNVRRGSSGEPPSASCTAEIGPHRMALLAAAIDLDLAGVAWRRRRLRRLGFLWQGADHGGAHRQLDAQEARLLGLPAGEHTLGVVGLDPALEEARGHRQLDRCRARCHRAPCVRTSSNRRRRRPRREDDLSRASSAPDPCSSFRRLPRRQNGMGGTRTGRDTSRRPTGPTRSDDKREDGTAAGRPGYGTRTRQRSASGTCGGAAAPPRAASGDEESWRSVLRTACGVDLVSGDRPCDSHGAPMSCPTAARSGRCTCSD